MAMTITNIGIIEYGGDNSPQSGRTYRSLWRVDYTGTFDPKKAIDGSITGTYGGYSMPKLYPASTCPWDSSAWCSHIGSPKFETTATGGFFTLPVDYDSSAWSDLTDKVEVDQCEEQREIFYAYSGTDDNAIPIVNSANQVFEQCPVITETIDEICVTGYRTTWTMPALSRWPLVNDAPVTIAGKEYPTGTLKYCGCRAVRTKTDGWDLIQHTWRFRYRESWDLKIPNMGTVDADGNRISINGRAVEQPYPLDADGYPLAPGFDPEDDVIELTFKVTKPINFSAFGFNF